jgi:hypothetical protein
MSKGTKVTAVRIPPALMALAERYLRERNADPRVSPWTLTDLLTNVLKEGLLKRGRSGKGFLAGAAREELRRLELPTPQGQRE